MVYAVILAKSFLVHDFVSDTRVICTTSYIHTSISGVIWGVDENANQCIISLDFNFSKYMV